VHSDLHGQSRAMYAQSRAGAILVAYHPQRPGTVAVCQSWLRTSAETVVSSGLFARPRPLRQGRDPVRLLRG
jgi:hypothetical protein